MSASPLTSSPNFSFLLELELLPTLCITPITPKVRLAVRAMLETRVGEPPLTGRELRLLVAMLDINGSNTLSRQEFEDGLRDCRWGGKGGGGVGNDHAGYQQQQHAHVEDGLRD